MLLCMLCYCANLGKTGLHDLRDVIIVRDVCILQQFVKFLNKLSILYQIPLYLISTSVFSVKRYRKKQYSEAHRRVEFKCCVSFYVVFFVCVIFFILFWNPKPIWNLIFYIFNETHTHFNYWFNLNWNSFFFGPK